MKTLSVDLRLPLRAIVGVALFAAVGLLVKGRLADLPWIVNGLLQFGR